MNLQQEIELYVAGLPKTDYRGDKLKPPAQQVLDSFRLICERTGLSPVTRQIYLVPRPDRQIGTSWAPQVSIDGFRAIAARSPKYQGQAGPFWTTGPGEPWTDIPPDSAPYAAKVGVYLEGRAEPTYAVAKFGDYNPGQPMWKKFPSTMVAKCAEALALRKALPVEMAGLYTSDEMAQADKAEKPKTKKAGPGGGGAALQSLEPEGESAEDSPDLDALIGAAESVDALKALKAELVKLPKDEQARLSPVYSARMKALKEAQSAD
jgi:phage recombination protein Bet